jgi:hypothetical protein
MLPHTSLKNMLADGQTLISEPQRLHGALRSGIFVVRSSVTPRLRRARDHPLTGND